MPETYLLATTTAKLDNGVILIEVMKTPNYQVNKNKRLFITEKLSNHLTRHSTE